MSLLLPVNTAAFMEISNKMLVKRQTTIIIKQGHPLYNWADRLTLLGNNLRNAARFRQRQVLTARHKEESDLTENELEILREFKHTKHVDLKTSDAPLSYELLYDDMYLSNNPDLFAKGLPRQSGQHVIRRCVDDMNGYWKSLQDWKEHPDKYKEKPRLPGYGRKGSHMTVVVTNQDCTISTDGNVQFAKMPGQKKLPLCIGNPPGRLKEVKVVPCNGVYKLMFTFDVEVPDTAVRENPARIIGIDFGVDNLMAVTNNIGAECLLYKGGIIKSVNRFYNKQLARIMAVEMSRPDCPRNKKGEPKFIPTDESKALSLERENRIKDFMFKAACHLIAWCVEHRIDTIVAGVNKDWKQEVCIGHVNNQNFVQIPFSLLRDVIRYKAEEHGIRYIEQEESYTSKASFVDMDPIPVYKKGDTQQYVFSGRRKPTRYKGMHKEGGFRGLYQTKDGTIINSDLNGSANILRKAFPDAFVEGRLLPDFSRVVIIKNPDLEFITALQRKQKEEAYMAVSRSKARRLKKKCAA